MRYIDVSNNRVFVYIDKEILKKEILWITLSNKQSLTWQAVDKQKSTAQQPKTPQPMVT